MLTFMVEAWTDIKNEASALWPRHYSEVGEGQALGWELNPDFMLLQALANLGKLHIVVARAEGKLVGYHASLIEPLLHYKQILASKSDLYWLAPEHRNGRNALRLFEAVEKSCRARGVQVMYDGTKLSLDKERLFLHLGYTVIEKRFRKWIG